MQILQDLFTLLKYVSPVPKNKIQEYQETYDTKSIFKVREIHERNQTTNSSQVYPKINKTISGITSVHLLDFPESKNVERDFLLQSYTNE